MLKRLRSRLTYANVMASIAAFLVLSGGTAAALSGSNTVQSDDLGPGSQVTAPDVAANAVNGSDIVDNSLTGADVNESSLLASRVIAQPTGGTLSATGLSKRDTPYPLSNATFTQRANEIVEFVSQIKSTLAPPGSPNTVCQVEVLLSLDGHQFGRSTTDPVSDQPETKTVATRHSFAVPLGATSSQHTVTATAHLVDHSSSALSDGCADVGGITSQIDSFTLDVIGTR
jgi:hypothetical protein